MKTESTVKYVLRLALTLLAITAVVAVILAGVNSVTAPRIAELNAEKTQAAIEAVLPGGGEEVAFTDDTGLVTTAYKGDAGYAIQAMRSLPWGNRKVRIATVPIKARGIRAVMTLR